MKKLLGIGRMRVLAAVAGVLLVAGYASAAGNSQPEKMGKLTVTGIPAEFEGKVVHFNLWSSPRYLFVYPYLSGMDTGIGIVVTNGEFTVPVYTNGSFRPPAHDISCRIADRDSVSSFTSVRFVNGVAKVNWNDGNVEWMNKAESAPSVATHSPSTGTTAIPAQMTQPAPSAPLVQLPLEKIFVGGTPPQGTRDDYAAVLPTLNDALDWLDIYTKDGGNYAIVMGSDQAANNVVLKYGDKRVTVSLTSSGGGRTVKGSGRKSFTVEKGVTFTLEEGVTISGDGVRVDGTFIMNGGTLRDANNGTVEYANGAVEIANGGSFTMNGGTITGNRYLGVYDGGGGVLVKGTFTMNGGTISGNTAGYQSQGNRYLPSSGGNGGGVYVSGGTFTMNGGDISGNSAISTYTPREGGYGGGVYVSKGTFTMAGGTISGNTTSDGGGVYLGEQSIFTLTGGEISGNKIWGNGAGGVYVRGTFTMKGGTISKNEGYNGGGVYVFTGTFTMSGGNVSGNSAKSGNNSGNGGGIYVYNGTFTMSGGTIGGNSAERNGGGVWVGGDGNGPGTFTKSNTGGIIYGSNAPAAQANKAPSEATGHVVYVERTDRAYIRTTTADETTVLDSAKNRIQGGGWE
jgi:hypothetical protein